jgi:hypothetical protein
MKMNIGENIRALRREKGVSYYRFYPESTANRLGAWVTGERCKLR